MQISRAHQFLLFITGSILSCGVPQEGDTGAETESTREKLIVGKKNAIPNQYIVVLNDDAPEVALQDVDLNATQISSKHGGKVRETYKHVLKGFTMEMSRAQAAAMANEARVAYVEEVQTITLDAVQTGATWGLDRIDQRALPLSSTYEYFSEGAGVNAYVIDTGIRLTHQEFQGRARMGINLLNDGKDDCHGHGTHVAGTIGGAVFGVAKKANLIAVKVFGCTGTTTNAIIISGIDWVTANHAKPAVVNMSLGGGISQALDDAVERSIRAGITYSIAAGNSNADACQTSPARAPNALTVAASTSSDARASFSNFGSCVDLFAPGQSITSAYYTGDTANAMLSGTSMAAPHVAGLAALYLSTNRGASPAQVAQDLFTRSTLNVISNAGAGTPNRLGFSGNTVQASSIKFADFNADGRADLSFAVGNSFRGYLSTSLKNPAWGQITHGGAYEEGRAQFADVTGDGRADLIFEGSCPAADVSKGINDCFYVSVAGTSGWGSPALWAKHGGSFQIGRAQYSDVTGDKRADLIFQGSCPAADVSVGINDCFYVSIAQSGSFGAPIARVKHGGSFQRGRAQYADVNADGRKDLIFQGSCPAADASKGVNDCFYVSLAQAPGASWPTTLWFKHGGSFVRGRAQYADINNDGRADLLYQGGCAGSTNSTCFYVSRSTTQNVFAPPPSPVVHGGTFELGRAQYADVNGDKRADLIYQGSCGSADSSAGYRSCYYVSFSNGTSLGSPTLAGKFTNTFKVGDVAYADMTGDLRADLLISQVTNFGLTLYRFASNGSQFPTTVRTDL